MVCAFLSAIYDYETDWQPILSVSDSSFLQLLNCYVEDCTAKQSASELFLRDLNCKLSKHGLERGSGAFKFYCSVIKSKWLAEYEAAELDEFGRLLQQVDDLLDMDKDKKYSHTNCFLTKQSNYYLDELRTFLLSDFFQRLVCHSYLYELIRLRCQHICHKLRGTLPKPVHIFNVHRPDTALYAGVAVLAGFKMAAGINWSAIVVALTFSLVTASIMVFNDIVERKHDRVKNKNFCHEYTWSVISVFALSCIIISTLLLIIAYIDSAVSLLVASIWIIGLLYSFRFVRKLYLVQNVIVAICSASPILCGAIYTKSITSSVLLVFCSLTVLVLIREFLKDVEDVKSDSGYKETLPTRKGATTTVSVILVLVFVATALLVVSPIRSVRMTAYGLALVQFIAGLALLHPERCRFVKYGIDIVLSFILLTILIVV